MRPWVTQRPDRVRRAEALRHLARLDEARHSIGNAREARDWPVDDLFELAIEAAGLGDRNEALECLKAAAGKPCFAQMKALALLTGTFAKIHPQIKSLG